MASKRPREQQPGVVDEMANAIVRQVKAQRIVTTKARCTHAPTCT